MRFPDRFDIHLTGFHNINRDARQLPLINSPSALCNQAEIRRGYLLAPRNIQTIMFLLNQGSTGHSEPVIGVTVSLRIQPVKSLSTIRTRT